VPQDSPGATQGSGSGQLSDLDTGVANSARMWNYWIGGKDNFPADRAAGDHVLAAMPALPQVARMLRRFLSTTVDELTAAGIRQFLDIGSGLPTADNTHEVAQRAAPESRIVYVDHDPGVIRQAQALLTSSPDGKTDYIQADLRDWATIAAAAQRTLDFSRPVAVLLIAVLHFVLDQEDPHQLIRGMMADLAPGSYLAIAHAASDIEDDYGGRDGPHLQRQHRTDDHTAGRGDGGPVLRWHGDDRPWSAAGGRMAGIQPGHRGRTRAELLLRYR
jgi:O-methyltransferase involved in polyketide biosynthesis